MLATCRLEVLLKGRRSRTSKRKPEVPGGSGRAAVHSSDDSAGNLGSCEPIGKKDKGPHNSTLENSSASLAVFALDQNRWATLKKARRDRVGKPYLRRCVVRGRRSPVPDRSNDNSREPAGRMVQPQAGRGSPLDTRSRVHSGLRGGKGCVMAGTVPRGTRDSQPTELTHRQRGCLQPEQTAEGCTKEPAHREQVPLPPTTGTSRETHYPYDTREEQPSRYPDEVTADVECEWMEVIVDEYWPSNISTDGTLT